MTLYESFLEAVTTEYDTLRVLKQSPRGTVSVVRHKKSGTRYVFRRYSGSGEVYRRLLPVLCSHLPQIMEAAEQDGQTAVLEEYVQGDTLAELLMGARLTEREARQVTMQLCQALHVLHSMGAVHRDVKPENVILRGSDAVLIDFDAARIYKDESESDTQVLGTTGFPRPSSTASSSPTSGRTFFRSACCSISCLRASTPRARWRRGKWAASCANAR